MSAKTDLATILNKKMDRKDFLRNVAIGLVAVTGVTSVVRAFTPSQGGSQTASAPQGYGSSAYGGVKKTS